jgi:hypothetical protein
MTHASSMGRKYEAVRHQKSNGKVKQAINAYSVDSSNSIFKGLAESQHKSASKPYRNVTGPGQYEHHRLIGRTITESQKVNQPKYSFGMKHNFYEKKPPLISKEHKVDYYSRESPGAGTYSPEQSFQKFSYTSIKWSLPKDTRFKGPDVSSGNYK